jgi:hypothetical protein
MIDALQWIATIGHFNINTAVMTLSESHMLHRVGHLHSSNYTYRYLLVMKHASIRVRTEEPDSHDFSDNVHDLTYFAYIKVEKLQPIDAPEPLGNHVMLLHYIDADLLHKIGMGKSATGIIHLNNMIPMEWYPKK